MTIDEARGVCPFSTEPEEISASIRRICVPFEDIYTSVFVLTTEEGTAILDSGSSGGDAETYIVPLLESLGREPDFLICSHLHGDHNGGTAWLLTRYPTAKAVLFSPKGPYPAARTHVAVDGEILLGRFQLLNLPGHTADALAVYDLADGILLTQDCLQKRGITRYGYGVTDVAAYLASIERVRALSTAVLIAAHSFAPGGYIASGDGALTKFLDTCIAVTEELADFVARYPDASAEAVAASFREAHPDWPDIWPDRVGTLRQYIGKDSV